MMFLLMINASGLAAIDAVLNDESNVTIFASAKSLIAFSQSVWIFLSKSDSFLTPSK